MKRLLSVFALVFAGLALTGAGCSSDPNVEGAKLNLRNRDYNAAMTNVEAALAKDPNNAEALDLKAQIEVQQALAATDPAERIRLFSAAAADWRRAGEIEPARAADAQRNITNLFLQLYQQGVQAFNAGAQDAANYNNAVRFFEAASTIAPDSTNAYVNRAYALIRLNRQAEAIAPLRMAIQKGERSADTYLYLSQLLAQANQAAESITVLEEAARAFPENSDIQTQLLSAYVAGGQTDRALASYRARVEAEPNNALYRYNYGSLLLQADRFDEAIEQLQAATSVAGDNANAYYNLGAALINKAVGINDEIQRKEDALRTERNSLSAAQRDQRQGEIDALVRQRTQLFQQAVTPLMRARELRQTAGEDVREVCRALFQSMANSGQAQEAQQYRACAGL